MRTCIPLNHTKRPRLAFCSKQCPLQFDATTAWHNLKNSREAKLSFWSSWTSYTLKICSTLASHPKYTLGSFSLIKLGNLIKGKEEFDGGCRWRLSSK